MDWLAENVIGCIPDKESLAENAKPVVSLQGVKEQGERATVL